MTAVFAMFRFVPAWCYWLLALVALCIGCELHGRRHVQQVWDADRAEIARVSSMAIAAATARNDAIAAQQLVDNQRITKAHNDEINRVRSDIARAPGLRIGPAICSGFAAATQTSGAIGSPAADPAGGLLPADLDRDIKALILETEEVAATGRACQAFVEANGMAP